MHYAFRTLTKLFTLSDNNAVLQLLSCIASQSDTFTRQQIPRRFQSFCGVGLTSQRPLITSRSTTRKPLSSISASLRRGGHIALSPPPRKRHSGYAPSLLPLCHTCSVSVNASTFFAHCCTRYAAKLIYLFHRQECKH